MIVQDIHNRRRLIPLRERLAQELRSLLAPPWPLAVFKVSVLLALATIALGHLGAVLYASWALLTR